MASPSAVKKDQAFSVIYVSEERPDPTNLSLVRAVQKTATLWAMDAREALKLFDAKSPRGVHYITAVQPAGVLREWMIEFTDEERSRIMGSVLVK